MLAPEFWREVHASEQERGNWRVTSPAADGAPWNDPPLLLLRPCSPPALSRDLACRMRCLKENCPCDKKLQALKKRILAQRSKCIPHLPEKYSQSLPLGGESRSAKPLKRKVCKAGAFSAPACPGQSERRGKKLRTGQNSASSSRKAEKERAVSLFGVSAWREGQQLARNIFGPPPKYQNLKTELKSKAKELLQESQGDPVTASQSEQSFRQNGQALQPETKKTKRERHAAELNRKWPDWKDSAWTQKWTRSHQKAPDTEKKKKNESHPRSAGRARKAGSAKGSSDVLKTTPSPKIQSASAKAMGMRETSRAAKGRRNGSSSRRETPRKEGQPATTLGEARVKPYSPEQLREFMDQKAAERNRRIREERRTSKEAQEERNKKLQEVYRKQREAAGRRSHCEEHPREGLTPITPAKNNLHLKYPGGQSPGVPKGVRRASWALLKKELKFNSELEPRMDKTAVTPVVGLSTSMDAEGQLGSPLELKQVDISSSRASRRSPSPFHLWREKVIGMETPFSSDISPSSSYRRKQDRVKAIHTLAKDLSERLGRETERFQATKISRDQGGPPGTPSQRSQVTTPPGVPLEKFDAPENAESLWGSRPSLNPPTCPRERAGLQKDLGVPMAKEGITQALLPTGGGGLEVMPMDSVERRQSGIEAKELKEGLAPEMGFGEKGPSGAPASVFPGSGSIHTLVEIPKASLKKNQTGGSNRQKKPPENPPGQGGLLFTGQDQPSGFPFPSINLAPGKASAAEDLSEPTDSNSQWSEIGQFYGGAASFGRLSLTLVGQSLREEELRARHQSALLRLREKALQEKAQAELAWLKHGECSSNGLQGTGSPSSTAEKQLSILTRLKQEQAEIRHLQNIGRAAHQERKLLLQQQKELLQVQKTTTQLWLQLAGQMPHQISENYNPQGVGVLEKEKLGTSFKAGPLLATCSEGRGHEGVKRHRAESKDILSPENRGAEGFAKWKPGKGDPPAVLEATIQDLYDPSCQGPQDPTLRVGRIADHLASRGENEHDDGLTKTSQEDHPGSPLDKGPEGFASAGSSSVLRGFCPYPEKSPSGLEFRKGYAVLVTLSGSSPSPSDIEDGGLQDTDVSLPEEFAFQEPLPGVSTPQEAPGVPRIVINTENTLSSSEREPQGQVSGGALESKDSKSALYSQEKIWGGTPGTERLEESGPLILSNGGRLRGTSPPGTEKDHVPTPGILRSTETPLTVPEELSWAENGGNEATSGSPVDLRMVFSSTNDPFWSPGAEGKKDPVPSVNGTGGDVEDGKPSGLGNKEATVTLAPDASLNVGAPQDSEYPLHGPKHSRCHRFPNSSGHLLASEDKTGCANRSTDECVSHKPDETSLQLNKTSLGNLSEEHRKSSPAKNQNTNEAGMPTVRLSSPQEVLLKSKGDALRISNQLLPELEDDVVSPVDEMLTYGSSDLPSSTENDVSSWSADLPAPPENLSGKDDNSSLLHFPPPPDPVASSEEEEASSPGDLPAEGGGGSSPQA